MNRPTSPRKHKKIQKELKNQGKSLIINPKSDIALPTIANKPMVEYSAFPQNINRKATQEPTILAHLVTQSQDPQHQLLEINPTIAKQQFVQLLPFSNLIDNSNHIEQYILNSLTKYPN